MFQSLYLRITLELQKALSQVLRQCGLWTLTGLRRCTRSYNPELQELYKEAIATVGTQMQDTNFTQNED